MLALIVLWTRHIKTTCGGMAEVAETSPPFRGEASFAKLAQKSASFAFFGSNKVDNPNIFRTFEAKS